MANERVRKVANNIIKTVAGTSIGDNGPATNAFLNFPEGIAIDGSGDILVADTGNMEAREFKAAGRIGERGAIERRNALWRDRGQGREFLSHRRGAKLSEPDAAHPESGSRMGLRRIIAGNGPDGFSGDGGPATLAVLNTPQGLAVDAAGNIYVADYGNHRVRKIDTTGNINTIAGNGTDQFSGDNGRRPPLESIPSIWRWIAQETYWWWIS